MWLAAILFPLIFFAGYTLVVESVNAITGSSWTLLRYGTFLVMMLILSHYLCLVASVIKGRRIIWFYLACYLAALMLPVLYDYRALYGNMRLMSLLVFSLAGLLVFRTRITMQLVNTFPLRSTDRRILLRRDPPVANMDLLRAHGIAFLIVVLPLIARFLWQPFV